MKGWHTYDSRLFQYEPLSQLPKLPAGRQKDYLRSDISLIQAEVSDIRYEEHKEAHPSIDISYHLETGKYGNSTGKRMFLPLNIFRKGFTLPSSSTGRTQDIVIPYGYLDTDSIELCLPENYEIESLPMPCREESPFGSFHSSVVFKGRSLHITHRLYMKCGRYAKEDYAGFLDFRKKTAQQYNAKIIIRRKE